MLRKPLHLAAAMALGLTCATAQITISNTGTQVPPASATTVGNLHVLETAIPANIQVGAGSIRRNAGAGNTNYLPTGWGINPGNAVPGPNGQPSGFTIEFWFKPAFPGNFQYLFGDASWVGVNGAFRCFANGAAGVNTIVIRGPLTQVIAAGTPLTTGVNANGFVHFALTYNNQTSALTWYVNGVAAGVVNTIITGTGTNLTFSGYNGSATIGPEGWQDDFRGYTYCRTAADVLADFNAGSVGNGASGLDIPDYYYEFEAPQNAHTGVIATNNDGEATGNRIFTNGTLLEWGGNSPQVDPMASALINLEGPTFGGVPYNARPLQYRDAPPTQVAYSTFAPVPVPGLELGHNFSTPANPGAILFPDALLLGAIGATNTFIAAPYQYSSPNAMLVAPGIFQAGDAAHVQWVSFDPTFPNGVANTNRTTFLYESPSLNINSNGTVAEHAHIEARGVNPIQNVGYWEVWNTGTQAITQVTIDLSTATTPDTFDPIGPLNTGGTLATLDSFRFNSQIYTGLNTATVPTVGPLAALTFDFTSFSGTIDHFIFDCDTTLALAGSAYANATVTVTFANGVVLTGQLALDPLDPQAAQIDL